MIFLVSSELLFYSSTSQRQIYKSGSRFITPQRFLVAPNTVLSVSFAPKQSLPSCGHAVVFSLFYLLEAIARRLEAILPFESHPLPDPTPPLPGEASAEASASRLAPCGSVPGKTLEPKMREE